MNIFVDGYGIVAHSIVRKILENHSVDPKNLLINTYHTEGNTAFLNYLKDLQIKHFNLPYNKLAKKVSLFKPDYFLSLYGRRIIPRSILNLVKFRSINLHPSLLPEYKGCFSCPWVIIKREKFTGITIHDIIEEVDAGEILYQEKVAISPDETAFSLYHRLAGKFIACFDDFFSDLLNGRIISCPMPKGGSYYPRRVPYDGMIDETWSEGQTEAFIRSMEFPPFRGAILKRGNSTMEVSSYAQFQKIVNSM